MQLDEDGLVDDSFPSILVDGDCVDSKRYVWPVDGESGVPLAQDDPRVEAPNTDAEQPVGALRPVVTDDVPNYLDTDDDGDGIRTILEDNDGDGPLNDDSDADGIADFIDAVDNGACGDPDGDGIPTGVEEYLELNPDSEDSDADGVSDTDEIGADALALFVDTTYCAEDVLHCLLYTSPSPRDLSTSRMPSSA